jgi:hypothetical protein
MHPSCRKLAAIRSRVLLAVYCQAQGRVASESELCEFRLGRFNTPCVSTPHMGVDSATHDSCSVVSSGGALHNCDQTRVEMTPLRVALCHTVPFWTVLSRLTTPFRSEGLDITGHPQ